MLKNKTILITGGAGFIGSSIVERLRKDNKLIVLDNFTTGSLQNLEGMEDVIIREGDCRDVTMLVPEKTDIIFHLGIASTTTLYLNNKKLVADEIEGSIAIYEKAVRDDTKVIVASSSSLYSGGGLPSKENQKIGVTDFYTECRLTIERLAELYSNLYGLRAICLRLFAVYGGKRERAKKQYANMVTKFIWAMQKGERPVSYGDGLQTRDFTYIEDTVSAFLLAAEYNTAFDIFNTGTGKNYTFNNVDIILNKLMNTKLPMEYEDNPLKNFVFHTLADTQKAEEKLGFKAEYTLERGIKKIIDASNGRKEE